MFYIVAFLLFGISFAPLFIPKLDMWHAQGIFVQTTLLIAFSYSFFEKPKFRVRNIPLGLMHLWIGLTTAYICYKIQVQGQYDIKHFLVYFNFLCALIFYNIVVQYLDKDNIIFLMKMMRYVVITTLIVCVFQRFNIAQFFKLLINEPNTPDAYFMHNNPVLGFIGNGTHLSGFLASTVPLFLWHNKREDCLALILMFLVLCNSGTTIGDPAISGFIVFICVLLFCFKGNKISIAVISAIVLLSGLFLSKYSPNRFFSGMGRVDIWAYYWDVFKSNMPITGIGLGTINMIYDKTPFPGSRHVHMEYLQYLVELGAIGGLLILNLINSFFHLISKDRTELCLKACVIGFLVSCIFNYPSHLWLPSFWALFFYAAFVRIKGKDVLWV